MVHGASSSGQTVFVEPLETIEQNNELVRLLDEELAEIHRILLEMTRRIGEQAEEFSKSADVLERVGTAVCQGSLRRGVQLRRGAVERSSGESRPRLVLHNARHPLLERNLKQKGIAVVPVTVELEGGRRQLVITGPNTGGKTVTLKTLGRLA